MAHRILPDSPFGLRVRERLESERVIWFTTVGSDGTPQPNPVWFIWDGGDEILTYNLPDSYRIAHIADRPNVALHFDGNRAGNDIVVLRGHAEPVDGLPAADASPDYVAKYGPDMARISGSADAFAARYSQPVRVKITRVRGH